MTTVADYRAALDWAVSAAATFAACGGAEESYLAPLRRAAAVLAALPADGVIVSAEDAALAAAWRAAEASLPADEANPLPGLGDDGRKFAGWMLELYRYPRPSDFPGDEGNQFGAMAMPAIDSHHGNAVITRAPSATAALEELAALLATRAGGRSS